MEKTFCCHVPDRCGAGCAEQRRPMVRPERPCRQHERHVLNSEAPARVAFEMAPKVLAGIVNVNSPTVNDEIHAPMGGVRDSGWGPDRTPQSG
jgi:hypothetical protein